MNDSSSTVVEALQLGARLIRDGVESYKDWAERVAREHVDPVVTQNLPSLYFLAKELSFHPVENWGNVTVNLATRDDSRTEVIAVLPSSDDAAETIERREPQEDARQRKREFLDALWRETPRVPVTRAIIIINVTLLVVLLLNGAHFLQPSAETIADWGANYGPKTMRGEWWRLLTGTFLHFGVIHLAFNAWVLWDAGNLVERLLGNVGFAILYLTSGLIGSIASLYWNPMVVSAGASGAVFGVFGGLIGYLAVRRDTVPPEILTRIRNSALIFIGFNVVLGLVINEIDVAAHFGGLVAGFFCGLTLSRPLTAVAGRASKRCALTAIGASASMFIAVYCLPPAPVDAFENLKRFDKVERTVLKDYNAMVDQWNNNQISDAHFAKRIKTDVLQPWNEALDGLIAVRNSRYSKKDAIASFVNYAEMRAQSWNWLLRYLQDKNAAFLERHRETWRAADQLLDEANAKVVQ